MKRFEKIVEATGAPVGIVALGCLAACAAAAGLVGMIIALVGHSLATIGERTRSRYAA